MKLGHWALSTQGLYIKGLTLARKMKFNKSVQDLAINKYMIIFMLE